MMKFSIVPYLFVLATFSFPAEARVKKLLDIIDTCKRNNPELAKCFCTNFNNVLPKLKDGVTEMNIIPVDPLLVEHVKMEFTQFQSVKLLADLHNVTVSGLSSGLCLPNLECHLFASSNGVQGCLDLHFPKVVIKSVYKMAGNFMVIGINTTGDFYAEISDLKAHSIWNSTLYMKNTKEHLNLTCEISDMTIDNIAIRFNNVFGNNTELNDNVNHAINEDIHMLYEEVKPLLLETIQTLFLKIANDFYGTFPYDSLYPK